jgi:hypothetical protein
MLRGRAARATTGAAIGVEQLDSGEMRNTSAFRGAPSQVFRTPGTADGWTAIYRADVPADRENNGPFTTEQRSNLLMAASYMMGFGHVAPPPPEAQLFDGVEAPGPALGCEASPGQSNAVVSTDDAAINIASGDLVVSGTAIAGTLDHDVTGAEITIADREGRHVKTQAVGDFATTGQSSWTASFLREDLDRLADGPITISGAFQTAGGRLGGKTLTILKDVVAPGALIADPAPGTYTGPISVLLNGGVGETFAYRTDGQPHGTNDARYEGPIALGFGDTTIAVRVTDVAGNSTDHSLSYTVNRPPAQPSQVTAGNPPVGEPLFPGPGLPGPAGPQNPGTGPTILAATLRVPGTKIRLRAARRTGLQALFSGPAGVKVARARLYRVSGTKQRRMVSRSLGIRAGREYRVKFAGRRKLTIGRYIVEVRVGSAAASLGPASTIRIRIVR